MFIYILKRIGLAFLTFIALIIIVYLLEATFGKDPFFSEENKGNIGQGNTTGDFLNKESISKYWLDKNPILRLLRWLGELFTGYLGPVYKNNINVELPTTFLVSFKWTLLITVPSFIFSTILGVGLGTIAAYKRAKILDTSIIVSTSVIAAVPTFVLAPIIIIFTYKYWGLPLEFQLPDAQRGVDWSMTLKSIIAPILVLTITGMSGYAVYTRNQMVNVLTSNHVLIAKTKGLNGLKIFWKHIIRNASIPIMAMVIPGYIGFLSGSILLERFFGVPGSALVIFRAQITGEINVVMFSVMFYSLLTLLTSIIVDVMYTILDPQIKLSSTNSNKSLVKRFLSFLARKKVFGGNK